MTASKWLWSLSFIGFFFLSTQAQQLLESRSIELSWGEDQSINFGGTELRLPHFAEASYELSEWPNAFPYWRSNFSAPGYGKLRIELLNPEFETLETQAEWSSVSNTIQTEAKIAQQGQLFQAQVRILPIRRNPNSGVLQRLKRADLRLFYQALPQPRSAARNGTSSELSDGQVFKIRLTQTGVYRLDYQYLKDLGIDVDNIDPRQIQLFNNGGGMLPERNSTPRPDDLLENPIQVVGESDGSFDSGDYILFFGQAPVQWRYVGGSQLYKRVEHLYSDHNVYFLKIGNVAGRRINTRSSLTNSDYSTESYDALRHYEVNALNLHDEAFALPPSGREWFGEVFKFTRERSFSFNFPNRLPGDSLYTSLRFAARAFSPSAITLSLNNQVLLTGSLSAVVNNTYAVYAAANTFEGQIPNSSTAVDLKLTFSNPSSSAEGWLDYLFVRARCRLNFAGNNGSLLFSDYKSLSANRSAYQLINVNANTRVWDVTDPSNVVEQGWAALGRFVAPSDTLRRFLAFDGSNYLSPEALGRVESQNLHGITRSVEMLIVYHPTFRAAAERLAAHRRAYSGLTVETVSIGKIYNEFSSGIADITAIRDFTRMLYQRSSANQQLKYLLLLGAGTVDYKSFKYKEGNTNFIPLYQTPQSLNPITSYTTDDFFGLMDAHEGSFLSPNPVANELPDLGIGRFTVRTAAEANAMVDKLIAYETTPSQMRDWRNRLIFMADDEDGNLHLNDADGIARMVEQNNGVYNLNKLYFDAFPQVSTAGGERYPAVQQALLTGLFKGALVVNYMGHGGDKGLAQERVFTTTEIAGLRNRHALPLFITATCSFSPHDDPGITSAGEQLFLNERGGAIALLSTVRVVYASSNERLTRATFRNLFEPINGRLPRMGEVLQKAKLAEVSSNSRKYILIGDPAMQLAYPKMQVRTTALDEQALSGQDTLRALQRVKISGEVTNENGQLLSNFNGTLYPTLYDKPDTITTLANDPGTFGSSPTDFSSQERILFKGRATVEDGRFSFEFIVPKDINYRFGKGKLSYYAENGIALDAHGNYQEFIIGGTASGVPDDEQGPIVQVFMNDEDFAFGGMTDPNPVLLVKLQDESGINTAGNGIGHDLTAVLDDNTQNTYSLNDFYEAALDDFTQGAVRYPLKNISDGQHSIRVKAWDAYNNSGEGYTEFVVASSADLALRNVLNYPNPFTTNTRFQFEHNFPNQPLDVQVQVFTVSGKLVKTIRETVLTEGYRVSDIAWDGLDEFGDRLARGVYIYKVTVENKTEAEEQSTSEFQKLVILR